VPEHVEVNPYLVFLEPNPDRGEISDEEKQRLQAGHQANIKRLHQMRRLTAAGPIREGGGLLFLLATSDEEARAMIAADPSVAAERFVVDIEPFLVQAGRICPAGVQFTMDTYKLVRFTRTAPAAPAFDASALDGAGPVVVAGVLGDGDGGVVLVDGESEAQVDEALAGLPAAGDPGWAREVSTLWIAREGFCR
jgi:uncharacterized protein YciI